MPDVIFEHPRLTAIYDHFDGPRVDLEHYLALVRELGAKTVLDVGSGTGCFATLLAEHGFTVTGLEPARSSLEVARRKPFADRVQWILGDSLTLPPMQVDLAVMTGNVAQVFVTDESWKENLERIHAALKPGGYLVFEARDPERRAWLEWTREKTHSVLSIPGTGEVESWCEVLNAAAGLVTFRWTYVFRSDGEEITSDSTLRFRGKQELEKSLLDSGFAIQEVRDAPDRPGKEFVFVATKATPRGTRR